MARAWARPRAEDEEEEEDEQIVRKLQEKSLEMNLYKARRIFLWKDVNDESAKALVTRLLSLDVEDPGKEIVLYINSPGGAIHDGLAIYDAMEAISSPVCTVCVGMAASMGAVLLACGRKGRRFAWPHARIMIHQPAIMGTYTGTATDLDIRARETLRYREELNRLLAERTGQTVERITQDTDRDYFMSAREACEYGLIDDIITTTVPGTNGR
ncbi:MAG: ATP-dependent Clp protease proteolytic subunit [Candidatus Latescibacterota bacterium]